MMADGGALPVGQRHFLDLYSLPKAELRGILDQAHAMKKARLAPPAPKGAPDMDAPLSGFVLGMIFEKPSTRTRVSFDMAIRQLGGTSIVMSASDLQLGRGETIGDTARVLSRYVDCLTLRTDDHGKIVELAEAATIPVINALTDIGHPCQILADLQTLEEHFGSVDGRVIAWIGDMNNMTASWIEAATKFPFELRVSTPQAYLPPAELIAKAKSLGAKVEFVQDPAAAAAGAECLIADTWVSMNHDESETASRLKAFDGYQMNAALLARAAKGAVVLHCLPAHRGEEITDEVIDGPQSLVWDEAENRLHVQKAILRWCTGR